MKKTITKTKRRDVILEQANRLFTEKGFAATSQADIAAAAGIRRESLYYYYPGKYDLLYEIIEPQIIRTMEGFTRIIAGEADARKAIRRGIENHLQQFNPGYLHMATRVRKNSSAEIREKFIGLRDMFKRYEAMWVELITRGRETGALKSAVPARLQAYAILGLCNSLSSWYRPEGGYSLADIAGYYTDVILDGVSM